MRPTILFLGTLFSSAAFALALADQPRFFIENKGQWPEEVLFLAPMDGFNVWITTNGATYDFYRLHEPPFPSSVAEPVFPGERLSPSKRYGHVVKVIHEGAATSVFPKGSFPLPGYYNYFIGNDPRRWARFVRRYQEVVIDNVYEGIAQRYYFDGGRLRYDYIVKPGADPSQIAFRLEGAGPAGVNAHGDLTFTTRFGEVTHAALRVFQPSDDTLSEVPARFVFQGGRIQIEVGAYDPSRPLIIDPLVYSTFIGGSSRERVYRTAVDAGGHAYVIGQTLSTDYPTTPGAYDTSHTGAECIFVTKLDATGSSLIYSTFIGGYYWDVPLDILVDDSGHAYVVGYTYSSAFPTTPGAYDTVHNGWYDVFALKLNTTGSDLLYSTFIGGSLDEEAVRCALDETKALYIAGYTRSASDFPITATTFDSTHAGNYDAFIAKLSRNGDSLLYSTFLGGAGDEYPLGIDIDNSHNIYIAGRTTSTDYPTTPGAYDTSHNGFVDAFVTKLAGNGTSLVYSTYLGGAGSDEAHDLFVDDYGNAYIAGIAQDASPPYPTTPGAYDTSHNGFQDVFVTKLNSTGSALVFSTFIGGSGYEGAYGIMPDNAGNIVVEGFATAPGFPTTSNAHDTSFNGTWDIFIAKLSATGSSLLYSTYLGGSDYEVAYGAAVDPSGYIYVGGYSRSTDYPTTSSAYSPTYNGGFSDAFVTKLSAPILPVTLIDFSGKCNGKTVTLRWQTASENNNHQFIVRRSHNPTLFFHTIGSVPGNGNTSRIIQYQFIDPNPLPRTAYYQLHQVDFDGTIHPSPIINVRCPAAQTHLAVSFQPHHQTLYIQQPTPPNEPILLRIYDPAGRIVHTAHITTPSYRVKTSQWPAGTYVVETTPLGRPPARKTVVIH